MPRRRLLALVAAAAFLVPGTLTAAPLAEPPPPSATTSSTGAADPVLVGAGDISKCTSTGDSKTAALVAAIPGTVFTTGDNVYPTGTLSQFQTCYDPTWGAFKSRTRPSPGNHDYETTGASGYYTYFGSLAGAAGKGYYAYDLGSWRIYALNSNCWAVGGCGASSAQTKWLKADLAANPKRCVLAYWHHQLFSSGEHGNYSRSRAFWDALYAAHADVILVGHDHDYERFARLTPSGVASSNGIRQFVVGTGGAELRPFRSIKPHSLVRNASTLGVLKLTLHATSYDWNFVPQAGKTFTDVKNGAPCRV
jgi:hypothetical protein